MSGLECLLGWSRPFMGYFISDFLMTPFNSFLLINVISTDDGKFDLLLILL